MLSWVAFCPSTAVARVAVRLVDGGELVYRVGRFAATVLDAADQMGDIIVRLRGLIGQLFDFGGDDGEAAASLARTGGFDRGVEGQ